MEGISYYQGRYVLHQRAGIFYPKHVESGEVVHCGTVRRAGEMAIRYHEHFGVWPPYAILPQNFTAADRELVASL